MVETSGWQQFLMLLYKGMILRKRHYIVTAIEILIPLVAASMILIGLPSGDPDSFSGVEHSNSWDEERNNYSPSWKNATIYPPTDPYDTENIGYTSSLTFIYCPDTDIAEDLMNKSIKLWLSKTKFRRDISIQKMSTEEDLISYALFSGKSEIIGTVLNNFKSHTKPEFLDYKIRFSSKYRSFYTNMKFRMDGPQSGNVYESTYFLSWQAAIEESFIEDMTNFQYEVKMQRFPYPAHSNLKDQNLIVTFIPWVLCYGFLIFTIVLVRRVTEEKSNGSKELLRMMGMSDLVYWLGTFVNYFIVGAILTLIICILYKVNVKTNAMMLPETNFFLLLVLTWLLMANTILFSFVITTFVPHRIFSGVVLTIVTVTPLALLTKDIFLPGQTINYFLISQASKLSLCLFPVGAAMSIFALIATFEAIGEGATWSNITHYGSSPDINMLMVMGMMVVSCLMYAVIIWYIDAVWPWQYGVTKPFYFPFTKSYWCNKGYQTMDDQIAEGPHDSEFFEGEPVGSTPGVVVKNLVKSFRTGTRTKTAVNNVSLNVYNGQITALLGHNGAGKTTTINILTGLFPPTRGTATINGWDILSQTTNARRSLGVCPQHNILYDTLTPDEHLKFYAGLKGVKWGNFSTESTKLLNMLHLFEKRNELVKTLSGGMKRKLSLAIALIGDSKVLFLDEPTSGMDPEARRSVWDALLDIRKDCTIILTTHYMEEADILGDRIAIMSDGEIQCCGSSIFLKKKLGTGYKLHMVKDIKFNLHGVTEILRSFIPDAAVETEYEKEVTFNLSCDSDAALGEMFEKLEFSKTDFGINSYGISVTTMEDVFLNAAKIAELRHKPVENQSTLNEITSNGEDRYSGEKNLLKSYSLYLSQLSALLVKRFHCSRRSWLVLIVQLALPLVIMCMLLLSVRRTPLSDINSVPALKMGLESVYGKTQGFYHSSENQEAKSFAENHFKKTLEQNKVSFPADRPDFDPQNYILQFGQNDLAGYLKTLMIGGSMSYNETLILTSWYNGEPYHTMPISLNLMNNAILKSKNEKSWISLTNAPLPIVSENNSADMMVVYMAQILAAVLVPLSLAFLAASYVMFPVEERASKSKLLQLMAGLPPWLYWCGMFIWDAIFHILICVLLLIPFAAFDGALYYSRSDIIGSIFLLLLLYGWCSIPFCYVISFIFKKPNTAFQVILIIFMLTGVMLSSVMTAVVFGFGGFMGNELPNKIKVLMWVFKIFPSFSVSTGISHIFGIAFTQATCNSISKEELHKMCDSSSKYPNPDAVCCKMMNTTDSSPLSWDFDKAGREAFFMFFEGILFFLLVMFLETSIPRTFWRFLKKKISTLIKRIRPSQIEMLIRDTAEEDSEVHLEEQRVEDLCLRKCFSEESLMVQNLTKVYKNLYAVDTLTFGVHHEECFGLLGVNGAGKTTTFKMLTGDVLPSEGNAYIQATNLIQNREKFQSFIGYCPQYDALLDKLTGSETLNLFAKLRGLSGKNMELSVNQLIRMVDLQEHADKLTKNYSGGNKRKLSLAIALIGAPPLILLDEPTSGVDPVSRRKIWKVLMQARSNAGCAIILTTHSMEESEALCNRLAIMVNGKFRCLGSLQQLKTKYGRGYTVIMKLKKEELSKSDAMFAEKAYFRNGFPNAVLTDDHQGMLQYHITDTSIPLSHLFKFMDEMKRQFNFSDYLISGTSLEQIFLAFARAQRPTTVEHA